ncbi:MAG: GAF domain-containing protein [Chloroflexi bacterium]|nr:GAF domain-containing protein [Chloroflexota bacterium]MCL5273171.1 GAF domain-containing protein [Chloroflexota bacterium]
MKRKAEGCRPILPFGISYEALRITLIFTVLSGMWIAVSDRVLEFFTSDPATITQLSTYKGWFYVIVVALFIYVERAAAERARLRATELDRQKSQLFDQAPHPMWVFDPHMQVILAVNAAAIQLYGYTQEEFERMRVGDLYLPEDAPTFSQDAFPASAHLERRHRLSNGTIINVEIETRETTFAGRPARLAVVNDVTARKQTDLSLRRTQYIVDNAPEPMARISRDGEILYINEAACRAVELPREMILHRKLWDVFTIYIEADWPAYRERLKKDGSIEEQLPLQMPDGRARYLLLTNSFVRYEDEEYVVTYGRDITARMETELALQQSEERIKQQLTELRALYAGAQELTGNLDSMQLARSVARNCVDTFGVKLAWVGQANANGLVDILDQYPPALDYPRQIAVRWDNTLEGQGPAGRAIRLGIPVVSDNLATDSTFAPWRSQALQYGFASIAAFPLLSRNQPFGALLLYSDELAFFNQDRVQFFQSYSLMAAAALENAHLYEETKRRLSTMQAQHKVDIAIASGLSLNATLEIILEQVADQLHVDAADILLLSPETNMLSFASGIGFTTRTAQQARLRLGEGYAGHAALEHRIIFGKSSFLRSDSATYARDAALFAAEGFASLVAMPLTAKSQINGVLEIFHRSPLNPDDDWLDVLETLAGQATLAIDNAALYDSMQRTNTELVLAYEATIEGWSRALDLRDQRTQGHTQRVAEITTDLARLMGLSDAELVHVRRGALLHDIGKIAIPDKILNKPGPLNEGETADMRRHPQFAYEMLAPITFLHSAIDIPYCHHEKWDGSGYPRGLKGREIPLAARIFSVVDVWDALRSDRPYRGGWPEEQVIAYILTQSGAYFDPDVVEAFMRMHLTDSHIEPA